MASEADMPPPLEDMTATLEQAKKLRDLRIGTQPSSTGTPRNAGRKTHSGKTTMSTNATSPRQRETASAKGKSKARAANATPPDAQPSTSSAAAPESANSTKSSSTSTADAKTGSGDFGGMRKGFLFGGGPSKTPAGQQPAKGAPVRNGAAAVASGKADTSAQAESMPFITSKPERQKSGLKFDQVQDAMRSTKGFLQNKDWVTEDLLEKVQKNELLRKRLGDPRFMQAITEFQNNPQEAIKKYEGSPEITTFLTEFCGLLGAHFTALGCKQDKTKPGHAFFTPKQPSGPKITEVTDKDKDKSKAPAPAAPAPAPPPPMDPQVEKILADPANRQLLMDPKIQQLIQHLRSSPEQAQKMLREGDQEFRQKLDRLISLGLLKFQG